MLDYTTLQNKKVGCWMGYFNWFHIFRAHRYSNENLFCTISSYFPAKSLFCTIFEVNGQILSFPPRSECSFHGTQNDLQDLMVSTQKSVCKTTQYCPRYWLKSVFCLTVLFGQKTILYVSRAGCIVFQTDFCIETLRSCRSFWVPWKLHSERKKSTRFVSVFTKVPTQKNLHF